MGLVSWQRNAVDLACEYLENRLCGLGVTWQSEETVLRIHEQSLSHRASQLAVRRCWLGSYTVWPLHSKIFSPVTAILALRKDWSCRVIWAVEGLTDQGDVLVLCQKSLHESCGMGRHIIMMKLICSLSYCECDDHTVHKLSYWRLIDNLLAPQESDCWWMHSKVSSDWLPSYIKFMRPVLEIIKMDNILSGRLRKFYGFHGSCSVDGLMVVINTLQSGDD
jgi:hypothetical protein